MIIRENQPTLAIFESIEDIKLAAILFDKILPLGSTEGIPETLLYTDYSIAKTPGEYLVASNARVQQTLIRNGMNPEEVSVPMNVMNGATNEIMLEILSSIDTNKFTPIPSFKNVDDFNSFVQFPNSGKTKQVDLELINAPVIITDQIEWKQITESKEDVDFQKKVRNFSLFINENYNQKDENYIKDSLAKKVEDYKEILGKHGYEYGTGAIKEILNSKSLWGTAALTLLASFVTTPAFTMVLGLVGGVIELGGISMKISEKELEISDYMKNSEIAMLIEMEKMAKMNKSS